MGAVPKYYGLVPGLGGLEVGEGDLWRLKCFGFRNVVPEFLENRQVSGCSQKPPKTGDLTLNLTQKTLNPKPSTLSSKPPNPKP